MKILVKLRKFTIFILKNSTVTIILITALNKKTGHKHKHFFFVSTGHDQTTSTLVITHSNFSNINLFLLI